MVSLGLSWAEFLVLEVKISVDQGEASEKVNVISTLNVWPLRQEGSLDADLLNLTVVEDAELEHEGSQKFLWFSY